MTHTKTWGSKRISQSQLKIALYSLLWSIRLLLTSYRLTLL